MHDKINWEEEALFSEIEFSKALGSIPGEYENFIHLYNPHVPWGRDFNRTVEVKAGDFNSLEKVVDQVEKIHREWIRKCDGWMGLLRPDGRHLPVI